MYDNTDCILKELVERNQQQIIPPPADMMWYGIRAELRRRKRADTLSRCRPVIAAMLAVVILSTALVYFRTPVMAFSGGILRYVTMFKSFDIFVQKDDMGKDDLNSEESGESIANNPEIAQIQLKAPFNIKIPQYIPKDYKLVSSNLRRIDDIDTVTMLFINSLDISRKECFEFIQQIYQANEGTNSDIASNTAIKSEQIVQDGKTYTFKSFKDNLNTLQWNVDDLNLKLHGSLPKKELLKIAGSIKQGAE